jgi:gentisate 1,2-dioxygenase
MQDNVEGRARVEDTPELRAYYADIAKLDAGALWTVANVIEPWEPKSTSRPMLWRYRDLRPHVLRALDLVTPERAGRRVVYMVNPGRGDTAAAVGWLYTGLQVMNPGESASAHRHSTSALRFIMEGEGAYTIVDGHKVTLGRNDFVLTPNGSWHEHGVDAGGTTCIWQDGLDIPLVNALEANFFQVHPGLRQNTAFPVNDTSATYGAPALHPVGDLPRGKASPLLKYEWAPTYAALCAYAAAGGGTKADGALMRYVNPLTGGHVMPTIGAAMQRLAPGQHTAAHRHTGSAVYQCAKGAGFSIIDGTRFDWQERDIFVVPSWAVHEHANASADDDAVLFQFNDLPVIEALGLYREEAVEG